MRMATGSSKDQTKKEKKEKNLQLWFTWGRRRKLKRGRGDGQIVSGELQG